jgi:mRNA-degrading endonuclease RelE of RelBE toxin-antitoxin system
MRVLITEQFNKSIVKLNDIDKKKVFSVFSCMENMSKQEIFESHQLIKLANSEEKIYVIRSKDVRIFCTFESDGGYEDMIFLDVVRKNSNNLKIPFNLTRR